MHVLSHHLPFAAGLQQGTPTSRDGPPETPFGMAGAPTPAWLPQQTAQLVNPEAPQEGATPAAVQRARALQRGLTPGFSGAASPNVSRQGCGDACFVQCCWGKASDASQWQPHSLVVCAADHS